MLTSCVRHENTGFAPYRLMFGRKAMLPIDLAFDIKGSSDDEEHKPMTSYAKTNFKERL